MMEGSGAGSVHVTYGSGCRSGRPKNIRIRITAGYPLPLMFSSLDFGLRAPFIYLDVDKELKYIQYIMLGQCRGSESEPDQDPDPDQDPHVFGTPRSGSGASVFKLCGSGFVIICRDPDPSIYKKKYMKNH